MRQMLIFLASLMIVLIGWPQMARAELTADDVRNSLLSSVRYLKEQQEADGSWAIYERYRGGKTALCTLALLQAGVDPKDPVIVKALRKLATLDNQDRYTYSVALQIMVFCMADAEKYNPQIVSLVRWLESMQSREGPTMGGWPYNATRGQIDNSNSQFALLALHEAARAGVKVDDQIWRRALIYWKKAQNPRGGAFGYINSESISGSMTCAGISSLIIAHENIEATEAVGVNGKVNCCSPSTEDVDEQVELAIDWISQKFSVTSVPGPQDALGSGFLFYYLYGLERAGRLAGIRFFGEHDWYREGAEFLIESQSLDGSWSGKGAEKDKSIATSFAILFLAKGRRPILIGKYKHASGDWDLHRKGVHYLTRAVERSWKKELNWQTVDAELAEVNDLLESPVLFISGKDRLVLSRQQKNALQEYVNQGGFIFAEACDGDSCDGQAFDTSFRELMDELFPTSQLQVIGPDHPLWFSDKPLKPNPDRPLLGLQACCRTSVVYCPRNLSCYWHLYQPATRSRLPDTAVAEVDYCIQLGVNVLAYATNQNLKEKLERHKLKLAGEEINERDRITVAKLSHDGGADDAPVALANLLQAARSETQQPFEQRKLPLAADDPEIKQYPFLFMHGRRSFSLTSEQRAILRTSLIARRFFLFGDAICGSKSFADSFRQEMQAIFPEYPLKPIAKDHPLLADRFGGFPLPQATLRTPLRDEATGRHKIRETKIVPALEAIEIDGRLIVVFSPYDLSCALENSGSVECQGYSTEDATKIGINMLLYALNN